MGNMANRVAESAREGQERLIAQLVELVSIESGTDDIRGVDSVGQWFTEKVKAIGFQMEAIQSDMYGAHRVFRKQGDGGRRALICLHSDTVWPSGTLRDWPVRVEGPRVYGPGVLDMKGSLVQVANALLLMDQAGWKEYGELVLYLGTDEQLGSPFGKKIVSELARHCDFALGMEPAPNLDNDAVVVGRVSGGHVKIEIRGISGHPVGGTKGASAIVESGYLVSAISELERRTADEYVNVGLIRGGNSHATTPDYCELFVGFRSRDRNVTERMLEQIRNEVAKPRITEGTTANITESIIGPGYTGSDAASEALYTTAASVACSLGFHLNKNQALGSADTNHASAAGLPCIDGLGLEGGESCTRREFVDASSFPRRMGLFSGILEQECAQ